MFANGIIGGSRITEYTDIFIRIYTGNTWQLIASQVSVVAWRYEIIGYWIGTVQFGDMTHGIWLVWREVFR